MLCRNWDSKDIKRSVTITLERFCAILHWEMLFQPNQASSGAGSCVRDSISRGGEGKEKRKNGYLQEKGAGVVLGQMRLQMQ